MRTSFECTLVQEMREAHNHIEMDNKLLESERCLEAILGCSSDQIWLIDREYRLVRANRSFFEIMKRLFGMDFQVGQNLLFKGLSDHMITKWKGFYDRALEGARFTIEYPGDRGLPLEGNDYEVTFSPVYDQNQQVVGVVCSAREFVAQNKTQHLYIHGESQLAAAQKLAQWGTWNFDLVASKVTWSDEMYNIFGTDKETFQYTYDGFICQVHEDDRKRVIQTSLQARNDGNPFEVEYRITTRAGELRYIHELGYAERNQAGKIIRLFGTAQNITLHKKAAEEVRLAYRQLRELAAHFQVMRDDERSRIERDMKSSLDQQLAVLRLDSAWLTGVAARSKENYSRIALPTSKGYVFVQVSDIIRCQSENTYTTFFMRDKKKLIICQNLKECETMLRTFTFFRVHNSHLINLEYIDEYIKGEGGMVRMSDGSIIDVSRRRKDEFLKLFKRP